MDSTTLDSFKEKLLEAAWQAEGRAYAPYSHFQVGSAILTDGKIFSGCNVENASYGLTVCAERNAIANATVAGCLRPGSVDAVLVAVKTDNPTFPCGACRQVLYEFCHENTIVFISTRPGSIHSLKKMHDLLPLAFGPKDLSDFNG